MTVIVCLTSLSSAIAAANDWSVVKMSGDVWVSSKNVQKIALTKNQGLKSGDQLTTGRNGRALLKRGKETILLTPMSSIALPDQAPEAGKTRILQRAGEIILEVEKRNVKHFEVQTPYLAAVVKGTRFSVKVDNKGASVSVLSGKVEVTNFKTGRFVMVLPGQEASVKPGKNNNHKLEVRGKGTLQKIKNGEPKLSSLAPVKVQLLKAAGLKKVKPVKSKRSQNLRRKGQ